MSRNLCRTDCVRCRSVPVLMETPRPITPAEAGDYFKEYEGMMVARAECPVCDARYLAWCDMSTITGESKRYWLNMVALDRAISPFFDLSFLSTFNDEPENCDLPTAVIRYGRGSVTPRRA